MKTITTLEQAKGKVLTDFAISSWGEVLLIFGNEYVCLEEDDDLEIMEKELIFCHSRDQTLFKKVFTKEEIESLIAKNRADNDMLEAERDRANYERLRKKFE